MVGFGCHFGSILDPFWEPFRESLRKVKIELALKREPHFHCPKGSGNRCFFDVLSQRLPERPLEPLLSLLGSILGRFRDPLGLPISSIFLTVFKHDFQAVLGSPRAPRNIHRRQWGAYSGATIKVHFGT